MQVTVHGKQLDVGDALRTHVKDKLDDLNHKYFNRAIDAVVTFAKEGHSGYKTHIVIHVGKNITVQATDLEKDPYAAFDRCTDKVGKQLRRYKRKLRDHHEHLEETPEGELAKAVDYVIKNHFDENEAANDDQDDQWLDEEPMVVAEMSTHIYDLTVSEAVMRMNLADLPAMMFRNKANGRINMVYRRGDGNISWVDPQD